MSRLITRTCLWIIVAVCCTGVPLALQSMFRSSSLLDFMWPALVLVTTLFVAYVGVAIHVLDVQNEILDRRIPEELTEKYFSVNKQKLDR